MKNIFVFTKKPRNRRGFYGNREKKDSDVNSGVNSGVSSAVNIVITTQHRLSICFICKHITTASDKKVEPIEVSTPNSPYSVTGNIIIDMEILSSILNLLACSSCSNTVNMKLSEVYSKKKGKFRLTDPGNDGDIHP